MPELLAGLSLQSEMGYVIVNPSLLFTPMSITPLIDMEDARIVLDVSRPSPKAILNDEIRQKRKQENLLTIGSKYNSILTEANNCSIR